jgi:hypothetical protein
LRRRKALNYIERLMMHDYGLGVRLRESYNRWIETLSIDDFNRFLDLIYEFRGDIMRNMGGLIQMIGQFRAYSLEEYVYQVVRRRVRVPVGMGIYWNDDVVVWRLNSYIYTVKFDVLIGSKNDRYVDPSIIVEAKVEVDAPRLKNVFMNFTLAKMLKPNVKTILVYVKWNASQILKSIMSKYINGVYRFGYGCMDDVDMFVEYLNKHLQEG